MKIIANLIIVTIWVWFMIIAFAGVDLESRKAGAVVALIVMCIFFAKELIIYEIEKLKK